MDFNPSKCEIISVTRKRSHTAYSYTLHGYTLNRVKSTKYSGLTITSDLNWNKHINNITARANQSLGFVKRNVKTRSKLIKTKVDKALVRTRLEYCSTVWDPQSKCATQRLEMVQRRAARYVLRWYHNTSSVSDMLDRPTLAQRRCCYRLTLRYKITDNLVAVPSSQYINPHQTRTTSNSLAYSPFRCKTNAFQNSFFPKTISQWDALPDNIVCAPSLLTFKTAISHEKCSLPSY